MYLNYYINLVFIPLVLLTNLMIFSVNSWFSLWIIMEFNLMVFIIMLIFDKKLKKDSSMLYVLIQGFNSYIFMFSILMILINNNINYFNIFLLMMNLSLITKLGMPPFFFWYMKIIKYMNWKNIYILSVFQKIIPMYSLNLMFKIIIIWLKKLNYLNLLISMILSMILCLNKISMRMIMGFSSIIHMSWMIIMLIYNEKFLIIYFFIYLFINLMIVYLFYMMNLEMLNQVYLMKNLNFNFNLMIMLMMISISGLPPMLGFLMKWMFMQNLFYLNFYYLLMMIFISLIFVYIYLRLNFYLFMINYLMMKNIYKVIYFNMKNLMIIVFIFLNILMLMIYELM